MKGLRGNRWFWFYGSCVFLLGLGMIIEQFPTVVEVGYSRTWYSAWAHGINGMMGGIPVSVSEIGLIALPILGIGYSIGWFIRNGFNGKTLGKWFMVAMGIGLGFVTYFQWGWGLNYYRLPLAKTMGVTVTQYNAKALTAVCHRLVMEANGLAADVPRNAQGVMDLNGEIPLTLGEAKKGYQRLGGHIPVFSKPYTGPKGALFSETLSWLGIAGIYSPFTSEAHVNQGIPSYSLPFTAVHEMAHVYGFAREDEANYIAWLGCSIHPAKVFRYSGALMGATYGINALYQIDPKSAEQVSGEFSDSVRRDLKAGHAYWKRYEGPAEKAQEKMNDRYLKANGQADGTRSYGRMVDLMIETETLPHQWIQQGF